MEEILVKSTVGLWFVIATMIISSASGITGAIITFKNYRKRQSESSQENINKQEILHIKESCIKHDRILETITTQYNTINDKLKDITRDYKESNRETQLQIIEIYQFMQKWSKDK